MARTLAAGVQQLPPSLRLQASEAPTPSSSWQKALPQAAGERLLYTCPWEALRMTAVGEARVTLPSGGSCPDLPGATSVYL